MPKVMTRNEAIDRGRELHEQGLSYTEVGRMLLKEGYAPPRSDNFGPSQVRALIMGKKRAETPNYTPQYSRTPLPSNGDGLSTLKASIAAALEMDTPDKVKLAFIKQLVR